MMRPFCLPIQCLIMVACFWSAAEVARADEQIEAVFFFAPNCRMCKQAKDAVRKAEAKFGQRLAVEWVDTTDAQRGTEHVNHLFALLNAYNFEDSQTPSLAVFVGERCLTGGEAIVKELDAVIQEELVAGHLHLLDGKGSRIGFWQVSMTALGDGINPCAFATIVLLFSMMATAHRSRREMLWIGVSFTMAVYITYFLIGLLLFSVLKELTQFILISDLIYLGAFCLCVVCTVLSLYDAIRVMGGGSSDSMVLKLPEGLRDRIRKRLSAGVRSRSLLTAAFTAGIVVSFLEAGCTGQIYFPVIQGLVKDEATRTQGILLLLWYNFLFVVPLLGVLLVSIAGVASDTIARKAKKSTALVKLLMAIVFGLMAWWMAGGLTWPPGAR